jgi:hypothetical protein
MKTYRITKQNSMAELIEADKVEILNSGQIVLHKNENIICVFSKDTDVVCVEEDLLKYQNKLKEIGYDMLENINKIDKFFLTDVFLKNNSIEDASDKLRRISMLVHKTIDTFSDFKI